ncbi:hypothetical protein [Actinomadura rugatobispora]|uniref:Uncharacterized protein n=1 Tax=Actinomadura rugatobispora TaxID=1994 RepID=A0ABW1A3A3_9ACTN
MCQDDGWAVPITCQDHPRERERVVGANDRYIAKPAAEDKFSGVVLLSHRGRTVLSRSYGMADKEKGIGNHEGAAFNLYGGPFLSLSIVQLAQRGKVKLWDTVAPT